MGVLTSIEGSNPSFSASLRRRGGRAVECGGLENRFGPLGPTRVQIPPPPLNKAVCPSKAHRSWRAAVSETASSSPSKSARVRTSPLLWVLAGERLANEHGLNPLDFD